VSELELRAARYAALGEPLRLRIVDELGVSDRSPAELAEVLHIRSNLLAHHLDVLEGVGLIGRHASAGDGRRRYVHLLPAARALASNAAAPAPRDVLFLCSANSARSQLAAAMWTARTGRRASSAGTHPAPRVHRGAVAAARRAGLSLADATPTMVGAIPAGTQVVTVCDRAHEELPASTAWWHWSLPDPVADGSAAAFDRTVAALDARIHRFATFPTEQETRA